MLLIRWLFVRVCTNKLYKNILRRHIILSPFNNILYVSRFHCTNQISNYQHGISTSEVSPTWFYSCTDEKEQEAKAVSTCFLHAQSHPRLTSHLVKNQARKRSFLQHFFLCVSALMSPQIRPGTASNLDHWVHLVNFYAGLQHSKSRREPGSRASQGYFCRKSNISVFHTLNLQEKDKTDGLTLPFQEEGHCKLPDATFPGRGTQ